MDYFPFMSDKRNQLLRIQATLEKRYGVKASWLCSVGVDERFYGEIIWAGNVEVFLLGYMPNAKRCYVWPCKKIGKESEDGICSVIESTHVNSPVAAVRIKFGRDREIQPIPLEALTPPALPPLETTSKTTFS